jgi:hypothetical protein
MASSSIRICLLARRLPAFLFVVLIATVSCLAAEAAAPAGPPRSPDFAVYAGEHLVLRDGARVRGGDVGVAATLRAPGDDQVFRVEIAGARVDGDVYGESVQLGPGSRVGTVYTNRLSENNARKDRVLPLPSELPLPAAVARSAAGLDELRVPARRRVVMTQSYTRVEVEAGATLVIPGGRFDVELLDLDEGSRLEVERSSVLVVARRLRVGPRTFVGSARGPQVMNLTIVVGGVDGIAPAAALIEDRAQIHALLLAPTGSLRLGEGVRVQGALQGRKVDVGPRSEVVYFPGLVRPATDYQCVWPQCDAVAGGQIECHPAPAVGLACSDGNACTQNDACNDAGRCEGQTMIHPDPSGANACIRKVCDPETGFNEPKGTACVPEIPPDCREGSSCDGLGHCSDLGPALPDGTACDDGNPANGADQCFFGFCIAGDFCQVNTCTDPADPNGPPDLDCWLNTHWAIRQMIAWFEDGNIGWTPYVDWSAARKQELKAAFEAAWQWLASGMTGFSGAPWVEPAPNARTLADLEFAKTDFTGDTARTLYFALVGHSLALEIRGGLPWSLCDRLDATAHILQPNTGHYSTHTTDGTPEGPRRFRPLANVTPAHPTLTYSFLVENDLIGATRAETIGRLLDWSRRLVHFFGGPTTINLEGHWQYRGYPPVSRTLAGTVATPSDMPGYAQFHHWTRGCWGTTGFLKNILMAANIPMAERWVTEPTCIHATPYFPSEARYLSHGDDPYGFFAEGITTVLPPLGAHLIDEATYSTWFTGPADYVCSNIGLRDAELGLALLPDWLAQRYCEDIAQNKDHASSSVAQAFSLHYSIAQLETADLWTRLSQRATDLGLWCGGM